jgi:multisubunit Na+/H+ antiporter MnhB subunit
MNSVIDLLLALGLVGLAVEIAAGRSLFRSIVTLVVFGLVMALAWARLNAPDLALAEAALGAGLTGALLLVSYRRLALVLPQDAAPPVSRLAIPLGLLAGALVVILGVSAIGLPPNDDSAGAMALQAMPQQPIANPVTAVLLLFRGYDTLLELAVLLAAWLGSRLVLGDWVPAPAHTASAALPWSAALLCVVVPVSVLVAGHLLHAGGDAPGGAFQAGAVLAAAGVLLALTGKLVALPEPPAGSASCWCWASWCSRPSAWRPWRWTSACSRCPASGPSTPSSRRCCCPSRCRWCCCSPPAADSACAPPQGSESECPRRSSSTSSRRQPSSGSASTGCWWRRTCCASCWR